MDSFAVAKIPVPVEVFLEIAKLENLELLNVIEDSSIVRGGVMLQYADSLVDELKTNSPALRLCFPSELLRNITVTSFRKFTVMLGHALGELVVQNVDGDKLVTVYDRDPNRSMADGARYHQTHEGGSIHTDNVNIPEPWEFLILSCLAQAPVGGENIIVDGDTVVEQLRANFPDVLKVLEDNFWWEKRGVSEELYQAPIITYDEKGHALFRHLRPYMESAHRRANSPMTSAQVHAVDVLDAYLNSSKLQSRFVMNPFECLLSLDSRTLHGRTCFADHEGAVEIFKWQESPDIPKRRTMERLWVRGGYHA